MRKKFTKIGKICTVFLLSLTLIVGTASYVFAAEDATSNSSGTSRTRWVGPAANSEYSFVINGKSYSGTKKNIVQYKDPTLTRNGLVMYLKHGQRKKGIYHNGSKSAYHRGYVQCGYVKITA